MSTPDGGPAFPQPQYETYDQQGNPTALFTGMTLRDLFAGMALQGFVTMPEKLMGVMQNNANANLAEAAAQLAYAFADGMIAHRGKP